MESTLEEWLNNPCLPEEVSGSEHEGFYLGIEVVKEKLAYMQKRYSAFLNYRNFNHFLFNSHNKITYASGSIEIELCRGFIVILDGSAFNPNQSDSVYVLRKLVGTATFDVTEYDNDKEHNSNYASILKSLATAQALKEYPQFGAFLNKENLNRTIQGKRISTTSPAIKNALKNLP